MTAARSSNDGTSIVLKRIAGVARGSEAIIQKYRELENVINSTDIKALWDKQFKQLSFTK